MNTQADCLYEYVKDNSTKVFAGSHNIHTPQALVEEILDQVTLTGEILVLFNVEFVISLVYNYNVNPSMISFYSDHANKTALVKKIGVNKIIDSLDNNNMKFDAIVVNPPYNKHGKEPLYYEFMRRFGKLAADNATIQAIIPIGWLVGPKARTFRQELFNTFDISRIEYVTNERFNGEVLQPTVIVSMSTGTTTEFDFVRTDSNGVYTTTVNLQKDVFDLGMPLYVSDFGKELIQAARNYGAWFETKTGGYNGPCVHIGPVNQSTYYLSNKPISWFVRNVIVKVQATAGGVADKARVFHRCANITEANNLRHWMNSAGARMIIAMWATSYRNTGSNVGQVPAVVVDGEYTNEKAYKKLGLSADTITWLLELDNANTEVL